jgi:hypothetical protein
MFNTSPTSLGLKLAESHATDRMREAAQYRLAQEAGEKSSLYASTLTKAGDLLIVAGNSLKERYERDSANRSQSVKLAKATGKA